MYHLSLCSGIMCLGERGYFYSTVYDFLSPSCLNGYNSKMKQCFVSDFLLTNLDWCSDKQKKSLDESLLGNFRDKMLIVLPAHLYGEVGGPPSLLGKLTGL